MDIHYLKYTEIDKQKWDDCINASPIDLPYAYSWYLDTIGEPWDALVGEDYKYVFPLTYNNKLRLKRQLYQPAFAQQLGIFSPSEITSEITKAFLLKIPKSFGYIDICLNEGNTFLPFGSFSYYRKTNYITPLNKPYEEILKTYSDNHQRNVRKSGNKDLSIENGNQVQQVVDIYKNNQGSKVGLLAKDYVRIKRIMQLLLDKEKGFVKNVYDAQNKLNLSMFFIKEKNRIINIFGSGNDLGRKNKAMYFAIDQVFQEFANQEYIFDFEGSSIPGVAYFFKGFGPEKRFYPQIVSNQLPAWMNMIRATKSWIQKK
jgi:hypothetical protein